MVMELFRTVNGVMDEIQRLPFIHHERIWETVSEHEAIAAALNGRDEARAAGAMAGHIRGAAGRIGIGLGEVSGI
jgi:DNA-binding GntR family transcriptional regulator